jgi:5-methylcytosine-specific restriction enzyme subunit McrC
MHEFIRRSDGRHFSEHNTVVDIARVLPDEVNDIFFQGDESCCCVEFGRENATTFVNTSYYVGLDWVGTDVIYVEPKINVKSKLNQNSDFTTDILGMLFSALNDPTIEDATKSLYEIKWDSPHISITQQQDFLTPLLLAEFFAVVKRIVRKGFFSVSGKPGKL